MFVFTNFYQCFLGIVKETLKFFSTCLVLKCMKYKEYILWTKDFVDKTTCYYHFHLLKFVVV